MNPIALASNLSSPTQVAVDDANVYWTNYGAGTVVRCAVAGCNGTPTPLAQMQGGAFAIALDAAHVYWGNQTGGQIMGLAK
jgi:hypothetical protein